jgi:hypothetical protein
MSAVTTGTSNAEDVDYPAPEELRQWMTQVLIKRCGGDYITAHTAVDRFDPHTNYPPTSIMATTRPLMMWCEDKIEAHDAIEWHRQIEFGWLSERKNMTTPRGPQSFKQSDLIRVIKAYAAAGVPREWIRTSVGPAGATVTVLKPDGEHAPGAWDDAVAALEARDNG